MPAHTLVGLAILGTGVLAFAWRGRVWAEGAPGQGATIFFTLTPKPPSP